MHDNFDAMLANEGGWPQLDSKGHCNLGGNLLTSMERCSGLSQGNMANTYLVSMRKCEDSKGPNMACHSPVIETGITMTVIDDSAPGPDRMYDSVQELYANMESDEKMFYGCCTVCHGLRDPGGFMQSQWRGITLAMFECAWPDASERQMVAEFLIKMQ